MPILYVDTPDLREEAPDEAMALVARSQWRDWRTLRLSARDSAEYRIGINALAKRLAEVSDAVSETQIAREAEMADEPAIDEVVAAIGALLPEWLEAVLSDQVNEAQINATWRMYRERLQKIERSSGPASAKFATIQRLAKDELPIATRHLEYARVYASKTVELDPLVTSVLRLAEAHPDVVPLLQALRDGVEEAHRTILANDDEMHRNQVSASDWARRYIHVSKLFRSVAETFDRASDQVQEANEIVVGWATRLAALPRG
jgi:hypothetical protein